MVFYHDNRKLRQQSRSKWLVDWVRADQTLMYACAHTCASMCLCVSTESYVYELMFAWTEAKRGSGCPPVSLSTVFFLRQCLSFNLEPGWFLASLVFSCNAGVTGLWKAMHSCLHVFWNVIPVLKLAQQALLPMSYLLLQHFLDSHHIFHTCTFLRGQRGGCGGQVCSKKYWNKRIPNFRLTNRIEMKMSVVLTREQRK